MTVAVMGQMTVAAEPGQPGGPKRDGNRTGSWRWGFSWFRLTWSTLDGGSLL